MSDVLYFLIFKKYIFLTPEFFTKYFLCLEWIQKGDVYFPSAFSLS